MGSSGINAGTWGTKASHEASPHCLLRGARVRQCPNLRYPNWPFMCQVCRAVYCHLQDWCTCFPCIEKAIPKIPFKCPNATSRVQLEGTIAAPAHWAMAAEAPASTDLTSIHMFLKHADGAEEQ